MLLKPLYEARFHTMHEVRTLKDVKRDIERDAPLSSAEEIDFAKRISYAEGQFEAYDNAIALLKDAITQLINGV